MHFPERHYFTPVFHVQQALEIQAAVAALVLFAKYFGSLDLCSELSECDKIILQRRLIF